MQHFLTTPTNPLNLSNSESSNLAFFINCPSYAAFSIKLGTLLY